jgi:hypothetical protein
MRKRQKRARYSYLKRKWVKPQGSSNSKEFAS